MAVGGLRELLDIQHAQGRVGDRLAEEGLRVRPEGGVKLLVRAVRGDEGEVDAHPFHRDGEEVVGPAVDRGAGDYVVPGAGDVEDGVEVGSLAGGGEHRGGAALQGADPGGDGVAGRVLQAGVEIAFGLQVEELAHVLAGVVFEGRALDDRDLAGFAVLRAVAALYADGFDSGHGHASFLIGRNGLLLQLYYQIFRGRAVFYLFSGQKRKKYAIMAKKRCFISGQYQNWKERS